MHSFLLFKVIYFKINETDYNSPSTCLTPKCLQQLGLDQAEARNSSESFTWVAGTQVPESSSGVSHDGRGLA